MAKKAKEAGVKPDGKKRRLGLLMLLVLLSGGALAGGLVVAMGPASAIALVTGADADVADTQTADSDDAAAKPAASGHGSAPVAATPAAMTVSPFKEIIVNISSTTASGRQTTRFLKLNMALVYDGQPEEAAKIESHKLYLRDSFQDYLRQLSERDLQGSYGVAMLKNELLRRARAITGSAAPQDILISDLIVQ